MPWGMLVLHFCQCYIIYVNILCTKSDGKGPPTTCCLSFPHFNCSFNLFLSITVPSCKYAGHTWDLYIHGQNWESSSIQLHVCSSLSYFVLRYSKLGFSKFSLLVICYQDKTYVWSLHILSNYLIFPILHIANLCSSLFAACESIVIVKPHGSFLQF